jgi:hypothetical protein
MATIGYSFSKSANTDQVDDRFGLPDARAAKIAAWPFRLLAQLM